MSKQIIKQPNGKYCLFSSIIDSITHYDLTPEKVINVFVEESRKVITKEVNEIITQLEKGEKPYYQFTMSYDEMLEYIKDIHGKEEMKKIKSMMK